MENPYWYALHLNSNLVPIRKAKSYVGMSMYAPLRFFEQHVNIPVRLQSKAILYLGVPGREDDYYGTISLVNWNTAKNKLHGLHGGQLPTCRCCDEKIAYESPKIPVPPYDNGIGAVSMDWFCSAYCYNMYYQLLVQKMDRDET